MMYIGERVWDYIAEARSGNELVLCLVGLQMFLFEYGMFWLTFYPTCSYIFACDHPWDDVCWPELTREFRAYHPMLSDLHIIVAATLVLLLAVDQAFNRDFAAFLGVGLTHNAWLSSSIFEAKADKFFYGTYNCTSDASSPVLCFFEFSPLNHLECKFFRNPFTLSILVGNGEYTNCFVATVILVCMMYAMSVLLSCLRRRR